MLQRIKDYFKRRAINRKITNLNIERFEIDINIARLKQMGFTFFERGEKRIKEIDIELKELEELSWTEYFG